MPDDTDAVDVDLFPHVPPNVMKMIAAVGFAVFENMPDEDKEIYDLIKEGKCMTCKGPLAEHTNFIFNRYGIVGGYCSGQCHADMATLGWLQEQHQDIMDAVKFRGGQGDEVE